ncbi:MAG: GspH/FimT family pseudopilin [Methylovulum sp.]|nr:GspH/FimT family pseudopilin [Methylovulum sp.]
MNAPATNNHFIRPPSPSGFTLVELLVTIAIIGITLGLAVPSFNTFISNTRMVSATNNLVDALNIARSKAISTHFNTVVAPITAGNWGSGLQVFTDKNNNATADNGEVLLNYTPPSGNITIKSSFVNNITYNPNGRAAAGSFYICGDPHVADYRRILVAQTGRIRMEDTDPANRAAYGSVCP